MALARCCQRQTNVTVQEKKVSWSLPLDKGHFITGVSPSFLSKVENGKKKPPIEWEEIIINEYGLSGTELEDFREAFFDVKNSESIDISRMAASDKELILSFARQFDSIDKMAIKRLLENKRIKSMRVSAKPLSRINIRRYAQYVRHQLDLDNELFFPIVQVMTS